jgi:hypothetical protein
VAALGKDRAHRSVKSRKGRDLSLVEIEHVRDIARSLAFTIEQMAKIDMAYSRAFGPE